MCGGRRRRERLLWGPACSGPGGHRGGREESAVLETRSAQLPGAAHPLSPLVLPSVPRREDKTKPKTLRTGGRKGEINFAERRAETRWASISGARWVGRGRSCAWWPGDFWSSPSGRRLASRALAGSRGCTVRPGRLPEACV